MNSVFKSTGIVALSTLASRILGFIRDMLLAACFGATGQTDAFFVAFKIPNLFRRFVAEGAMTISFIPVYSEYLVNRGSAQALELAQKTFSVLLIILVVLVALGEYFSPEIVRVFAAGFSDADISELAVLLNRIMFPYLFFVSLVAFAMGFLNSHKYFFSASFAPVFLNIGIICGILIFANWFSIPLVGVAAGVLFGGLLQVLLQIPYMIKAGFRIKLSVDLKHPGIRKIFSMLGPALFGMAVYQINSLIITVLASYLEHGAISYIYYSDRLTELVLGVFIVSIGNVILPEMSKMSARESFEELKSVYLKSVKAALFMAVPASAALLGLGLPIISAVFMRNSFSAENVRLTYSALFCAGVGIPSLSVLRLTTPTFYALKDTRTPVIGAVIALFVNFAAGILLMNTNLKHAGLTLALSISSTVQVLFLVALLRRKLGSLGFIAVIKSLVKYAAASAVMLAVCIPISLQLDWTRASSVERWAVLIFIIVTGIAVYAAACRLLRTEELMYLLDRVKKLNRKNEL